MDKLNFFSYEKLTDRLYKFTEGLSMVHRLTIGVAVGDKTILVIDTGMGMTGTLREYIESVVGGGKAMICACTHLHPDHASSACLFDEAYCSHLDYPRASAFAFSKSQRLGDLEELALHNKETLAYCHSHMIHKTETVFKDVKDGDRFDLGGIEIECIELPGHTPGSMAYFDRAGKHVFTGDSINTDTHFPGMSRDNLMIIRDSILRFIDIVGDDTTLHPAHLPMPMSIDVAKNLARACDDIVHGRVVDDPPGDTMFAYRNHKKPNTPDMYIHYVNNTGLTYDINTTGNAPHSGVYNFLSHEQISDRIFLVTENYSFIHRFSIGVVVGDNTVLVIDAGMGMTGDLRRYIENFVGTDKPIWCACTHGAIDHVGAAILFDRAFLNPLDNNMLPGAFRRERRLSDLEAFSLYEKRTMDYCREHMLDNSSTNFEPLQEGDIFDLGGITVCPIALPGHSKGHMVFYVPAENIVFTGDGVNIDTHIKALNKTQLCEYSRTLRRFANLVGSDAKLFAYHTNRPHTMRVAKNLIAACQEVSKGQTMSDPPGETIFTERNNNPAMRMHYYGNSCIVYNNSLG